MSRTTPIDALVLDLDGVLYVGDTAVPGADRALAWLRERKIPFRFITNTTTRTPGELLEKLERLGLPAAPDEVFTALSATCQYLRQQGRPSVYPLVGERVKSLFEDFPQSDEAPDFVVIGDIGAAWDYETLNRVFNMIMAGAGLICMHRNRYWQTEDGLRMDIGAFVAALEYVTGKEAIVIGKPAPDFFRLVLASLGTQAERTAIVGDDIESDVGGGQAAGLKGILVRTGKFRESALASSSVQPDLVIDSIAELPAQLANIAGDGR
jgi:HAD superfamily hydrolase (TIGR01458 family)